MLPDALRYSTILLHARLSLGRSMIRYTLFVQPCVYLVLVFIVFYAAGRERTFDQAALTAALVAAWGTVVFTTVGEIGRERSMGTLAAIAITPAGLWGAFLRKAIGSALLSGIPIVGWTIFVVLSLGLGSAAAGLLFAAMALFVLSVLGLGLLLASLLVVMDRSQFLMNYLELPVFLLSGFFFPASVLNPRLQDVGGLLPTYWPVAAMRDIAFGQPAPVTPAYALAIGAALTAGTVLLARAMLRRAEFAARQSGALDEQKA